jgi:hypothetical protein
MKWLYEDSLKYHMTIKDVIDIPKGEEREIFFMDRNIIDIADRNEKNVEMLPSDFFKDCYFIKFIKTDDGIRGTWFWNKHYLDDVGNCPEHKEFDIDLGTFWYPLKDNKVPVNDQQGIVRFGKNAGKHYSSFPNNVRLGWRGPMMLKENMNKCSNIIII